MNMAARVEERKIVSKPSLETKLKWCKHLTRELWIGNFISLYVCMYGVNVNKYLRGIKPHWFDLFFDSDRDSALSRYDEEVHEKKYDE